MICGWPHHPNAADWRTHIPSLAFAPCNVSKDCSVSPALGSSLLCGGEKNDLRYLRHGASQLVRPQAPAGAGSVLRRSPHLPRSGGASGRLPALWLGEARAAGLSGRQRAAHEALCAVRGPTLSQWCDPDVAAELHLDWQTVKRLEIDYMGEQIRRAGTPGPKVIGIDEISIRKGHTYRIV